MAAFPICIKRRYLSQMDGLIFLMPLHTYHAFMKRSLDRQLKFKSSKRIGVQKTDANHLTIFI